MVFISYKSYLQASWQPEQRNYLYPGKGKGQTIGSPSLSPKFEKFASQSSSTEHGTASWTWLHANVLWVGPFAVWLLILEGGEMLSIFCEHILQKAFFFFVLFGRGKKKKSTNSGIRQLVINCVPICSSKVSLIWPKMALTHNPDSISQVLRSKSCATKPNLLQLLLT